MTILAINVGRYISTLCYSILKLEPYSACQYSCKYCYGRWYRESEAKIKPQYDVIRAFIKVSKVLSRKKLGIIPFRLSTLIEPFQKIEENYKLSLKILKVALKNKVPIIISTKSTLYMSNDWWNILKTLNRDGLVIIQETITTLDRDTASILEPNAPTPEERVEAIEKASRENIPVVIRFQPLIPGYSENEAREIFKVARSIGAKHIIIEFLRCPTDEIETYKSLSIDNTPYEVNWKSYSISEDSRLVTPPTEVKAKILERIVYEAKAEGVKIALCKEGLFNFDMINECCGIKYMRNTKLRLTLKEFWIKALNKPIEINEVINEYAGDDQYLVTLSKDFQKYPRLIRKPIKHHKKHY